MNHLDVSSAFQLVLKQDDGTLDFLCNLFFPVIGTGNSQSHHFILKPATWGRVASLGGGVLERAWPWILMVTALSGKPGGCSGTSGESQRCCLLCSWVVLNLFKQAVFSPAKEIPGHHFPWPYGICGLSLTCGLS